MKNRGLSFIAHLAIARVSFCYHLASVVNYFIQRSLKPLGQLEPNMVIMVLGWSSLIIVSDRSVSYSKWVPAVHIVLHWNIWETHSKSSLLKLLGQLEQNLVTMVLVWSPLKIMFSKSGSDPRCPQVGNIV